MNQEIYDTVVGFIVETCDIEVEDIRPDIDMLNDLKIDSIMLVEVVFDIEEEYGISVPLDDWQTREFRNADGEPDFRMSTFVDGIEQLIKAKNTGAPQPLPIYKQQRRSTESEQ